MHNYTNAIEQSDHREQVQPTTVFTNREFVALVRAKLDASGHDDVAIERRWIDEEIFGDPWLLNVPVGTELCLPLRPQPNFFEQPIGDCDFHAEYFAKALINIRKAEKSLTNYARNVRRAANVEITAARADDLDLMLKGVGFNSVYADHLSGDDWKDAAMCVVATVDIGCLSLSLRPETMQICVDYPENIVDELRQAINDQRERQQRLADLDMQGCDLEVDSITLDLLAAHGLNAPDVLRTVLKQQCTNYPVKDSDDDEHFFVVASNGSATASLASKGFVWNGEYLWFRGQARAASHDGLVGRCLGDRVNHPALKDLPILKVERSQSGQGVDLIYFDMSRKVRFDAETGRLWPVEVAKAV